MSKSPQRKPTKEVEIEPGAWARFEKLIGAAAKVGPQHKTAKPKKKRRKSVDR